MVKAQETKQKLVSFMDDKNKEIMFGDDTGSCLFDAIALVLYKEEYMNSERLSHEVIIYLTNLKIN